MAHSQNWVSLTFFIFFFSVEISEGFLFYGHLKPIFQFSLNINITLFSYLHHNSQSLIIIFVYCTQLLENWSYDTNYCFLVTISPSYLYVPSGIWTWVQAGLLSLKIAKQLLWPLSHHGFIYRNEKSLFFHFPWKYGSVCCLAPPNKCFHFFSQTYAKRPCSFFFSI